MAEKPAQQSKAVNALVVVLLLVVIGVAGYFVWRAWVNNTTDQPLEVVTRPRGGGGGGGRPASAEPYTLPARASTLPAPKGPLSHRDLVFGGLPKAPEKYPVLVLENIGYISGYSEERKNPLYVAYHVFDVGNATPPKRPDRFSADLRTSSRVSEKDYEHAKTGYDRGHMAPNRIIALCYGPAAQLETFEMTNISPQTGTLNQKVWNALENLEAREYPRAFDHVWVVTGPIFDESPKTIGPKHVPVPAAFYKILIENKSGKTRTMSVVMPQDVVDSDRLDLKKFLTPIREIEAKTGLDFFPELPREEQDRLEVAKPEMWVAE